MVEQIEYAPICETHDFPDFLSGASPYCRVCGALRTQDMVLREMAEQIEEVEIDIDGWWVVWDKTVSPSPEPWAVFTSKEMAEAFHQTLIDPSDFDVKKVTRK